MKNETINARTTTSDKVTLAVQFERELPETLQEAVDMFASNGDKEVGEKVVFGLFYSAFVIAMQAPARKMMAELWEELPEDARASATQTVDGPNGPVFTGTIPEPQMTELVDYMKSWVPGQKSQRRTVIYKVQDPVKAIMDQWDTMSPERRMEIMELMTAKFGA